MELKDYQRQTLETVEKYLMQLALQQTAKEAVARAGVEIDFNVPEQAWKKLGRDRWHNRQDGLGRDIPHFCLKIPTGGGKTLLAARSLDLIGTRFLRRKSGLALWIVPSTQIYRQTLSALRDRQHPYRQALDAASGGCTVIREKGDLFRRDDVENNLVVLMLMLPSANRATKEYLRMFRDSGGFDDFFPDESSPSAHEAMLAKFPNLDRFEGGGLFGWQVKTSLGNAVRLLDPVIILDEGHKAYSDLAVKTLCDFNPSLILELSATPDSARSNVLVSVSGRDLEREQMIKLDLHLRNKDSDRWQSALEAGKKWRDALEEKAREHKAATNQYIRPINVIQVERTGKDQRSAGLIHSEDVREWLVSRMGVLPEEVAVKTSEKDELKEVDDLGGLMSPDCPIRYIITKQALQEGWDCPFAYVLTILPRPGSKNALTQLIGRILRQPYARKTGVPELDESYVYCYRQEANQLLDSVRQGLEDDGMGDLVENVSVDGGDASSAGRRRVAKVRPEFKKTVKSLLLPIFVVKGERGWRPVSYEADIERRIDWEGCDCTRVVDKVQLAERERQDTEIIAGFSSGGKDLIESRAGAAGDAETVPLDAEYLAHHLTDVVANPWMARQVAGEVIDEMVRKDGAEKVTANGPLVIDSIRSCLVKEKDQLAKEVFLGMLKRGEMRLAVIAEKGLGYGLPDKVTYPDAGSEMRRRDGEALEKSLMDYVRREDVNGLEQKVAWYLDEQKRMFFWYRNRVKEDYGVQGWRRHKVYPDFIYTSARRDGAVEKIFLIETKGEHLLGSEDTNYKKALFELCNQKAREVSPDELALVLRGIDYDFRVLPESGWEGEMGKA
jgi:type III restriction enzyme